MTEIEGAINIALVWWRPVQYIRL